MNKDKKGLGLVTLSLILTLGGITIYDFLDKKEEVEPVIEQVKKKRVVKPLPVSIYFNYEEVLEEEIIDDFEYDVDEILSEDYSFINSLQNWMWHDLNNTQFQCFKLDNDYNFVKPLDVHFTNGEEGLKTIEDHIIVSVYGFDWSCEENLLKGLYKSEAAQNFLDSYMEYIYVVRPLISFHFDKYPNVYERSYLKFEPEIRFSLEEWFKTAETEREKSQAEILLMMLEFYEDKNEIIDLPVEYPLWISKGMLGPF